MSPESVLRAVTGEPSSATTIYRRRELLSPQKSLTQRHRHRRRACARVLEALAAEGLIQRAERDSEGHPVPVFWRSSIPEPGTLPKLGQTIFYAENDAPL